MAYNINFCEGNLEAVPAWFWCSLRTKQKTLTLFTHLPNFNLAKKITTLLLIQKNTIGTIKTTAETVNRNYSRLLFLSIEFLNNTSRVTSSD